MVNGGDDDEEDDGDKPGANASNTSDRSNRMRRSSVFNSFLSWKSWKATQPGNMAHVRDSVTPRKVPIPPISSSGGTTSQEFARSSVDEDVFVNDEDALPVIEEKDDGKTEEAGSTKENNV